MLAEPPPDDEGAVHRALARYRFLSAQERGRERAYEAIRQRRKRAPARMPNAFVLLAQLWAAALHMRLRRAVSRK